MITFRVFRTIFLLAIVTVVCPNSSIADMSSLSFYKLASGENLGWFTLSTLPSGKTDILTYLKVLSMQSISSGSLEDPASLELPSIGLTCGSLEVMNIRIYAGSKPKSTDAFELYLDGNEINFSTFLTADLDTQIPTLVNVYDRTNENNNLIAQPSFGGINILAPGCC